MAMKPWVKSLLTFLAGVVATAVVILTYRQIQNEVQKRMTAGTVGQTDANYQENLARITQEVMNETREQIVARFTSNFDKPLPPTGTGH